MSYQQRSFQFHAYTQNKLAEKLGVDRNHTSVTARMADILTGSLRDRNYACHQLLLSLGIRKPKAEAVVA